MTGTTHRGEFALTTYCDLGIYLLPKSKSLSFRFFGRIPELNDRIATDELEVTVKKVAKSDSGVSRPKEGNPVFGSVRFYGINYESTSTLSLS